MPVQGQELGTYELIETLSGTTLLGFNGEEWYAWVEEEEGELLVFTDDTYDRRRMINQGEALLVYFEKEPGYRDMPHLFLGRPGKYEECLLPNGLPDQNDTQKRIVPTGRAIGKDELERHLESVGSDHGETSSDATADRPIDDCDSLSVDETAERLIAWALEEIEKLRQYEELHQGRKHLRHMFSRHLAGLSD